MNTFSLAYFSILANMPIAYYTYNKTDRAEFLRSRCHNEIRLEVRKLRNKLAKYKIYQIGTMLNLDWDFEHDYGFQESRHELACYLLYGIKYIGFFGCLLTKQTLWLIEIKFEIFFQLFLRFTITSSLFTHINQVSRGDVKMSNFMIHFDFF